MKISYRALKLRTSTLIRVLKRIGRASDITLTYVETTRTASILLKFLKQRLGTSLFIRKIGQRYGQAGPLMNLAEVRNDKDEVITIDIYHHILDIRRKICSQLIDAFKTFDFFKNNKPFNMLTAYLGMEIAKDITPAVYMAHYARWKDYTPGSKEKGENILVIPDSPWSENLVTGFKEYVDLVKIDKKQKTLRLLVKVIAKCIRAVFAVGVFKCSRLFVPRETRDAKETADSREPGKILTIYRMGLLKDQRNDIAFFHSSSIEPGRLLILLRHAHHLPSEAEMEWMKQGGVQCISTPGKSTAVPGVPNWKPSKQFKKELEAFYGIYIKTAVRSLFQRKKNALWLLDRLWKIGLKRAYWKDFFISNHVRIIVNSAPAEENFMLNLALSETNGIAVTVERSILFDYCTYIHNPPNHISFVTGPYSLTQIPEPSFSLFTLQSGGLNVNVYPTHSETEIEGLRELRHRSEIVISVFDEVPNDWFFGDSVRQMYQALINLVDADADHCFSLFIKTKKPQIFERLGDVNEGILRLSREGRCWVASWKVTASAAAAGSDMVVCVPSTAAFESVLTGTRTIVYNPMRSGSRLFYTNNGLNRRVFEDSDRMIESIKRFARHQDDSIGDCSDLVSKIDPFYDGRGSERVGQYLNTCLQGFDRGLNREDILEKTNEQYGSKWGKDKLVKENAYEVVGKR
jgi:hypothetical protein